MKQLKQMTQRVLSDLFTKQVNIYSAEMPKAKQGKGKQITDARFRWNLMSKKVYSLQHKE